MDEAAGPVSDAERNAIILRRTLSAASWITSAWSAMFGALAWRQTSSGLYDARLILLHAVLLGLAGYFLWRPRRGAVAVTLIAAAGSLFFVAVDLQRNSPATALVDGVYPLMATALLYKSRRHA